mmetsp:Transcript_2232/g.6304  ORF Transcript_2232/g.6304 Transcript_2232/m.6304 type:complete len:585 (+) Transcript_2232:109-1863(+)
MATTSTATATTTSLEVSGPAAPAPSVDAAHTTTTTTTTTNRQPGDQDNEPSYSPLAVALIFLVPALGGFLFGYDISGTSFVLQALTSSSNNDDGVVTSDGQHTVAWSQIIAASPVWQGLLVAASSLGAFVSSAYIMRRTIGRRTELQLGAVLYICGATLESARMGGHHGIASQVLGLTVFLTGRIIYGFGIGITMHAAPTYLGEMVPSSIRGALVSGKEACIVLGIVMGYTIGAAVPSSHWPSIYTSTLPFSVVMLLVAMFLIPESGRYLLLQDPLRYEPQAMLSMEYVFPHGTTAQQQVREIQASIQQEQERRGITVGANIEGAPSASTTSPTWKQWMQPQYRLPLTAGLGLVILQQVTGQPSVLSYATQILEQAGLMGSAAIPIALFKLVATLYAASVVEQFGRVKLLMSGCSLMLVALLTLAFYFGEGFQIEVGSIDVTKYLVLLALFMYIGGYQVGFGPVTWLMTSEVFPLAIRGQAVALAVQLNFLLNALVQFGVPVLQHAIGLAWTFGIFAILDLLSLFFVRAYVPETKGLTLEQIERIFQPAVVDDSAENERVLLTEPLLRRPPVRSYSTNSSDENV